MLDFCMTCPLHQHRVVVEVVVDVRAHPINTIIHIHPIAYHLRDFHQNWIQETTNDFLNRF